jgi:hypothetical protein
LGFSLVDGDARIRLSINMVVFSLSDWADGNLCKIAHRLRFDGSAQGVVQQGPSNAFETHMLLLCATFFDRLTERTEGFEGIDRVQSQTTTEERFLRPNLRWVNL